MYVHEDYMVFLFTQKYFYLTTFLKLIGNVVVGLEFLRQCGVYF